MIALISHASKKMLKILQVRLQQYMNHELPNVHVVAKRWTQLSELAQQWRLRHREQMYGRIERMIHADI